MSRQNRCKAQRREERQWYRQDWRCWDCNMPTNDEYYMVHDELWATTGLGRGQMLCIGCLERRIGRELVPADFTDAPINSVSWNARSERLMLRLGLTLPGGDGMVGEVNRPGDVGLEAAII